MYLGDFLPAATIDFDFPTRSTAAVPTTLAGTPAVSVYKSNSTTETTTGVTLTVDFDSRTGMNHVRIDLSLDATFYAPANDFDIVITAGTVGGVSVVGEIIGHFSIINRTAFSPFGRRNTLQAATSTTATLDASASAVDNIYEHYLLYIATGTGAGQTRTVLSYVGSTKVAAVDRAWTTTPDSTSTFIMLAQAVVDVEFWRGSPVNVLQSGRVDSSVGAMAADVVTASAIATDAIGSNELAASAVTEIQTGLATPTNITAGTITTVTNLTNAPTAGDLTATMKTSVQTAADSAITANALINLIATYIDTEVAAIKAKTDNLPASPAAVGSAMTLTSAYDFAKGTTAVTESYNADGAAPTPVQALMVIMQMLTELSFSGTTGTVKKLDGSTTAFTLTINDATTPTSITRAT